MNFSYLFLIFISALLINTSGTPTINNSFNADDYKLVWSDEFNGKQVDTSNWNFETGNNGYGNHEQEYYQRANATVEDGNLIITGKKEDVGTGHYT